MKQDNRKKSQIIVAEFHQETNIFNEMIWTEARFRSDVYVFGNEVLERYHSQTASTVNGIVQTCQKHGYDVIPVCAMHTTSGGAVDQAVADQFLFHVLEAYRKNPDVAGFFLALHGATQSTEIEDICGYILERIRRSAGNDVVITVGCDLHANVTHNCMKYADCICGFQTYPHVDQYETGCRSAEIGIALLEGKTSLYWARAYLPMIVPATGYSTEYGAFKRIMDLAQSYMESGEIVDVSLFQMQPWLDVSEAGSAVLVAAETESQALSYCRLLAEMLYENRENFWPELCRLNEAVELAKRTPAGRPVILVDAGDSPGAGALGNSAFVLGELMKRGEPVQTAFAMMDPTAVDQAFQAGCGSKEIFRLGGTLEFPAVVMALYEDGVFVQEGPVDKGLLRNLGRTARICTERTEVLICEHLCGTGDLQMYRHFGIEPTNCQMVVIKASMSFRSAYERIASEICVVGTEGASSPDLIGFPYRMLPENFYPFRKKPLETISEPEIYWKTKKYVGQTQCI